VLTGITPDQALALAVRLCCVARLIGLVEVGLARRELEPGGFLDWGILGIKPRYTRTRAGSYVRGAFRRVSPTVWVGALVTDVAVSVALLLWPAQAVLIAAAVAMQIALLKRHHLVWDGSDRMTLVVLVACFLGRLGADAVSLRAAVTFLAAEVALAYLVSGAYKAASPPWRSGAAVTMIVQTRMFGQRTIRTVLRRHSVLGRAMTYTVVCWESLFLVALIAPLPVCVALLAIGLGFHLGCAVVMGLNRFVWVFGAAYPAVLCTNSALRGALGAPTSDALAVGLTVVGLLALVLSLAPRPTVTRAFGLMRHPSRGQN
jgi:hypothetical protein